jgi:hypothetical protein
VGEVEPPTFVMPLWACDQFVVSKVGQEPDLTGSLEGKGMRRTEGIRKYLRALTAELENTSEDNIYTFCLWGISQYLDCINWEVRNVLGRKSFPFETIGGTSPMNIVCYELNKDTCTQQDVRHLRSQKNYYFNVALWSALHPPSLQAAKKLRLPQDEDYLAHESTPIASKVSKPTQPMSCFCGLTAGLSGLLAGATPRARRKAP